jgi:hypothetical protein
MNIPNGGQNNSSVTVTIADVGHSAIIQRQMFLGLEFYSNISRMLLEQQRTVIHRMSSYSTNGGASFTTQLLVRQMTVQKLLLYLNVASPNCRILIEPIGRCLRCF